MPETPSILKQGWNFAAALVTHIATGAGKATDEQFRERLQICNNCDKRVGNRCSLCQCRLMIKLTWKTQKCPIDKWGKIE